MFTHASFARPLILPTPEKMEKILILVAVDVMFKGRVEVDRVKRPDQRRELIPGSGSSLCKGLELEKPPVCLRNIENAM